MKYIVTKPVSINSLSTKIADSRIKPRTWTILSFFSMSLCRLWKIKSNSVCDSALDKLLGHMGIYATWLSSIAYLQIFIFFTPHFFFCNYTFSYCMKPSEMCLHIYSLPSSAFLKYQTSGFYCTWSKSHPLVDIRACTLCNSFTFITVFFREILDWEPIF